MKLITLMLMLTGLVFAQGEGQSTITERHGVLPLSTIQSTPMNMYSTQKMDLLVSVITTTRPEVNQYNVIASYEYEGVRLTQVESTKVRGKGGEIVVFNVPPGIKNVKICVIAGTFTEIESREFE